MFISEAYAQSAGAPAGGAFDLISLLPLVAIFVVFYFLLIRPQQKKAKEHRALIASVRRGDKVVTGGGILGTVTKVIDDHHVQVEIAENVRVRVVKSTLADIPSRTGTVAAASGKRSEEKRASADEDERKDESESEEVRESTKA